MNILKKINFEGRYVVFLSPRKGKLLREISFGSVKILPLINESEGRWLTAFMKKQKGFIFHSKRIELRHCR